MGPAARRKRKTNTKFEIFAERNAEGKIKIGKSRRYRWRLVASNGETVAASEGYHNKRDCERIIVRLRQLATEAAVLYLDDIAPSRRTSRYRNPLEGRIISR
jgi:uncharacterized protein YegP (UPF0339 family)